MNEQDRKRALELLKIIHSQERVARSFIMQGKSVGIPGTKATAAYAELRKILEGT